MGNNIQLHTRNGGSKMPMVEDGEKKKKKKKAVRGVKIKERNVVESGREEETAKKLNNLGQETHH